MNTELPLCITLLALALGALEAVTIVRVSIVLRKNGFSMSELVGECAIAGVTIALAIYVIAMAIQNRLQ